MAKTFDNISEASATNYLFLFAQRTLALQNEPPTPPPLNALGLPCEAICRLWARRYPEKVAVHRYLSLYLKSIGATGTVAAEEKAAEERVAEELQAAAVSIKATDDKARSSDGSWNFTTDTWSFTGSVSSEKATQGDEKLPIEGEAMLEERAVAEAAAGEINATAEKARSRGGALKEKTFAEKMAPLAKEITEYILGHQDDAAQEDRWRTTMKRETMKRFRELREASDTQGQTIAEVREAIDKQREVIDTRFDKQRNAIDEVHQLIKKLANANRP